MRCAPDSMPRSASRSWARIPRRSRSSRRSAANCAIIHARKGNLPFARALVERAAELPESSSTGPIVLAAAALIVGFALWDEELVARCCSSEIVEAAFSSKITSTLGRIAGPYARWLHALRKNFEARSILRRAIETLRAPFGGTDTFIAAAELGDEPTRARAYAVIEALEGMTGTPIYAATSQHLRALRAIDNGETAVAADAAASAGAEYAKLGWPMHQAQCLELMGDLKERASAIIVSAPLVVTASEQLGHDTISLGHCVVAARTRNRISGCLRHGQQGYGAAPRSKPTNRGKTPNIYLWQARCPQSFGACRIHCARSRLSYASCGSSVSGRRPGETIEAA